MRRIVFGGGTSLDNFIAGPGDEVDWLMWGDEAAEVTSEFWKTIDTVLMGRRTYQVAANSGHAEGYPRVANYVFSSSLERVPEGVTLVREDAVGFVRRLKAEAGKDICLMGGGQLARTFFEAGLIDEVGLNIHPILLGEGIPAFHRMERRSPLHLEECRRFENGCVYVRYRVSGVQ